MLRDAHRRRAGGAAQGSPDGGPASSGSKGASPAASPGKAEQANGAANGGGAGQPSSNHGSDGQNDHSAPSSSTQQKATTGDDKSGTTNNANSPGSQAPSTSPGQSNGDGDAGNGSHDSSPGSTDTSQKSTAPSDKDNSPSGDGDSKASSSNPQPGDQKPSAGDNKSPAGGQGSDDKSSAGGKGDDGKSSSSSSPSDNAQSSQPAKKVKAADPGAKGGSQSANPPSAKTPSGGDPQGAKSGSANGSGKQGGASGQSPGAQDPGPKKSQPQPANNPSPPAKGLSPDPGPASRPQSPSPNPPQKGSSDPPPSLPEPKPQPTVNTPSPPPDTPSLPAESQQSSSSSSKGTSSISDVPVNNINANPSGNPIHIAVSTGAGASSGALVPKQTTVVNGVTSTIYGPGSTSTVRPEGGSVNPEHSASNLGRIIGPIVAVALLLIFLVFFLIRRRRRSRQRWLTLEDDSVVSEKAHAYQDGAASPPPVQIDQYSPYPQHRDQRMLMNHITGSASTVWSRLRKGSHAHLPAERRPQDLAVAVNVLVEYGNASVDGASTRTTTSSERVTNGHSSFDGAAASVSDRAQHGHAHSGSTGTRRSRLISPFDNQSSDGSEAVPVRNSRWSRSTNPVSFDDTCTLSYASRSDETDVSTNIEFARPASSSDEGSLEGHSIVVENPFLDPPNASPQSARFPQSIRSGVSSYTGDSATRLGPHLSAMLKESHSPQPSPSPK